VARFDEAKQDEQVSKLRAKEEEELAQILSNKYGVDYTDLSMVSIDTDALRILPEKVSREANLAIFRKTDKRISVAVLSPAQDKTKQTLGELVDKGYEPTVFMVSTGSLEHAWKKYAEISYASASKRGSLEISDTDIKELTSSIKTIADAQRTIASIMQMKKAYRTSRIAEVLLASAIALDASDLHVEPEEKLVRLRFRLDGLLSDITTFDIPTYQLFLSRAKLISGLKLNIKNSAQDGRFSIHIGEKEIEIRTSVIPSEYGESVVLRILNPDSVLIPLEKLGMTEELLNIVAHEIEQPNGLLITTGPTGSGKTTMLYAFLRKIYTPNIKVVTLEDPIEYHMEGIVQTQVDQKRGYSFALGLRSILRQDPDVIMVGEMRDKETAKTAINASLTGHMVFSTLHTNDAAGAIPRLIELGIEAQIIPSSLRIAMAQRLVRKLCESCKRRVKISDVQLHIIENVIKTAQNDNYIKETAERSYIWEPVGCISCANTGYKGRIGIFEALLMDERVENAIRTSPTERALAKIIIEQGIPTMAQDGVLKILRGITSFDELLRIVELEDETS